MATFLALCEQLREELGVGGTISTVVGQVGQHRRLINYIKKANRKIQSRKTNWKFLWASWSNEILVESVSEFLPPDGLRQFDETSFWLDADTSDAIQLKYIDYKQWRDVYRVQYEDDNQPAFVTIKPNGNVAVLPAPGADCVGSVISADYWRSPVELVDNSQISLIPPQFHDVIVAQAKMYFAEKLHDTGLYNSAFIEHEDWYRDLKGHSLPGFEDDNKSQSSLTHVIEVL